MHKAAVVPISEVMEHHRTNTIGSLVLFQAVEPLLRASIALPRFIVLSSSLGSIGDMEKVPEVSTAYGSSKAALNYIVRKIHLEYPYLIAFPLHPGCVKSSHLCFCSLESLTTDDPKDGSKRTWETLGLGLTAWKRQTRR